MNTFDHTFEAEDPIGNAFDEAEEIRDPLDDLVERLPLIPAYRFRQRCLNSSLSSRVRTAPPLRLCERNSSRLAAGLPSSTRFSRTRAATRRVARPSRPTF